MSHEFHSLIVKNIVRETSDSSTICFEVPVHLSGSYDFKAGQYLTLKINVNGAEERRAYSICSSPLEKHLAVNVKRVNKGLVSNYVNDNLKVGQSVEVMSPDGRFTLDFDHGKTRDLYFFASGSGITPIISLIKTALEEEPKSNCYLCYGNRNESSIIFKEELEGLQKKYSGQLFIRHILSRPHKEKQGGLKGIFSKGKESWKGWKGRVDRKRTDEFLDENKCVHKEQQYFICGPGAMIDTIVDHLEQKNISNEFIHTERFIASGQPQIPTNGSLESSWVKVHLSGKEFQINVSPDKTILDVLIDEKYDPPYSCTSGACSTCVAKLIEGQVSMDACYALDDDEVAEGYILTCQSRAITENVELTFDT